jgi:nitrogen fixation protein FixH
MVLACLIAFFGVVFAVNAVMIRAATSTFGGVETASSFQAGQAFARESGAARAQDARAWQVKADVRIIEQKTLITIDARDAEGRPVTGLVASATLHHPTDARGDHPVALGERSPGHFDGATIAAPGQWDVRIELARGGERLFRSRNRVVLK